MANFATAPGTVLAPLTPAQMAMGLACGTLSVDQLNWIFNQLFGGAGTVLVDCAALPIAPGAAVATCANMTAAIAAALATMPGSVRYAAGVPVGAPTASQSAFYVDTSAVPPRLYFWDGSAWQTRFTFTNSSGSTSLITFYTGSQPLGTLNTAVMDATSAAPITVTNSNAMAGTIEIEMTLEIGCTVGAVFAGEVYGAGLVNGSPMANTNTINMRTAGNLTGYSPQRFKLTLPIAAGASVTLTPRVQLWATGQHNLTSTFVRAWVFWALRPIAV